MCRTQRRTTSFFFQDRVVTWEGRRPSVAVRLKALYWALQADGIDC